MSQGITASKPSANSLEQLQNIGNNGEGIKIAIIDGSIDSNHQLFDEATICQSAPNNSIHGTAVASLIAGKAIGLTPKATILSYPVFSEDKSGNPIGCSEITLANAINKAASDGCNIVNVSGATPSLNGLGSQELRNAVQRCKKQGILIVAAVGNDAKNTESLPASLDYVLAVGACDEKGNPAPFNNHGTKLKTKMLLASGVNMPVAKNQGSISVISGSSFSTPVVSATAALIQSALGLSNLSPNSVKKTKEILIDSASVICSGADEKSKSTYRKLHIPAVLERVKQELLTKPQQQNQRYLPMSDTQSNNQTDAAVLPAQTAIDEPIIPASSSNTESPVSAELSQPVGLQLPSVADSAPQINVHQTPSQVSTQEISPCSSSDPRVAASQDKIFIVGTLGYDFGTEARLDYFTQVMGSKKGHPFDPIEMAKHLNDGDNAEQSNALIWLLKIDGIPVYAVEPDNQFAVIQYARLVQFLNEQETQGIERVSIAGVVSGETRLFNGQVIPKISPVLRGMFNWSSDALAKEVLGSASGNEEQSTLLCNFLNRVYYELRNLGRASQERAINYAATNAYQMKEIFDDAFSQHLVLSKISAEPSPVCRPDSDCWDVVLEFFNPNERLTNARKLYRYTVDVSDLIPVTVGTLRSWHAY
ncbi:PatA/PatG family cyanobactin maturation protease [Agarivorans albus]|uniref:Subtilisin DY n=1 Tax=Agarivorans albus MKT 106 TaxID=1331007 RepID=R9PRX7_AGAAL|nr:PatA/PatG family cyanobactin maturation protease [Agarivorans albus]GAD00836.1 subtilisin DY [Agarivorans albus MKT 106]